MKVTVYPFNVWCLLSKQLSLPPLTGLVHNTAALDLPCEEEGLCSGSPFQPVCDWEWNVLCQYIQQELCV